MNFFPKKGTMKNTKIINQKTGLNSKNINTNGSRKEPKVKNTTPINIRNTEILLSKFTIYDNPFTIAPKILSKNLESPTINFPKSFFTLFSKFFL